MVTGNHRDTVRVRCDFCGAEYETAVSKSALAVVNRCDRCGLSQLSPVEDAERRPAVKAADDSRDERPKA
jgi:ribosome-binding protein aMBF1 (putative translation factor)